MSVILTIIIGFIAGVIAKFITPGDNEPSGFILIAASARFASGVVKAQTSERLRVLTCRKA